MSDVQLLRGFDETLGLRGGVEKTKGSQWRQVHIDDDFSQIYATINRFFCRRQFFIICAKRCTDHDPGRVMQRDICELT
jgi:hypothetical protein